MHTQDLDFIDKADLAGFRLHDFEVYNWGTFDGKIWPLHLNGKNGLLAGINGAGKTTYVDAITTLLVPPQRITYNRAGGAERRERDLRSYVLGYHKTERSEANHAAKPVALRKSSDYSVLLGVFKNAGTGQIITLAQVFWAKSEVGQPSRFFVVAGRELHIGTDFADFGADIADLRRRLSGLARVELFDSFTTYSAHFRRHFGIGEQAINLFLQTVSMKQVDNLTQFVRNHMLDTSSQRVRDSIDNLLTHFDNLSKSYNNILVAKDQIGRLEPLVGHCDKVATLQETKTLLEASQEALVAYFAGMKRGLLSDDQERQACEHEALSQRAVALSADLESLRKDLMSAHAEKMQKGGQRLATLETQIQEQTRLMEERKEVAERYTRRSRALSLPDATDAEAFDANTRACQLLSATVATKGAQLTQAQAEAAQALIALSRKEESLLAEQTHLERHRSNIDARLITLREKMCEALDLPVTEFSFAGEVLQVRADESAWEGAAERILGSLGKSLLVPDQHHARVAAWVNQNHLNGLRLTYHHVRDTNQGHRPSLPLHSLVRKIEVQPESPFYTWLSNHLADNFDYACCRDIEQFHQERKAVTLSGLVKTGGSRHEKDDRHAIEDRRYYVLGWDNSRKRLLVQRDLEETRRELGDARAAEAKLTAQQAGLRQDNEHLIAIAEYSDFARIDWQGPAKLIVDFGEERHALETADDVLLELTRRCETLEESQRSVDLEREAVRTQLADVAQALLAGRASLTVCDTLIAAFGDPDEQVVQYLDSLRLHTHPEPVVSTLACDQLTQVLSTSLRDSLSETNAEITAATSAATSCMASYLAKYPETTSVDANIAAAEEWRGMLTSLRFHDLPAFEATFKQELREQAIREVASLQMNLINEQSDIVDRVKQINQSLKGMDYNEGRYISIELSNSGDVEIRTFQDDLKNCTANTIGMADDEVLATRKFLQVKALVDRLNGREKSLDADQAWRDKVTDVRAWFSFSASERWRESTPDHAADSEHEHYTDSGGKSGGQKEKLAYTMLAASLAYQYGLEADATGTRTFRFVVVDEAFSKSSDDNTKYALTLFKQLNLQLLVSTPMQKIHVIEPFISSMGFIDNPSESSSQLLNMSVEEYRVRQAIKQMANPAAAMDTGGDETSHDIAEAA